MLDRYVEQVRLLLSTLPEIAKETVFALKGRDGHQPVLQGHAEAVGRCRPDLPTGG